MWKAALSDSGRPSGPAAGKPPVRYPLLLPSVLKKSARLLYRYGTYRATYSLAIPWVDHGQPSPLTSPQT